MSCVVESQAADALARLSVVIAGVDVSGLVEADLARLLAEIRTAQRCLDGLVIRVGVRCDRLAATGQVAPTEDLVRGGGTIGSRQARREAARAVAAQRIDGLSDAASAGEISGEHVDSIARHIAKLPEANRTAIDTGELIEKAKELPVETFDRFMKRQVDAANADHGLGDAKTKQAASEFRHWYDRNTGMGRISGTLDPERYEAVTTAIEQHMSAIATRSADPITKNANLAAHALVELATSASKRDVRNRLPHVTVIVDHDTIVHGAHDGSIRQTQTGHDLPPETIARLCCDATIRRITLDNAGLPLNVGRKHRTATDAQWAAIKSVHTSCAWDGCDIPINWCQAHHIREWENGGPTDLQNLTPLCNRHHHRVHEGQWTIKQLPTRALEIYRPDGTYHSTAPTPQRC